MPNNPHTDPTPGRYSYHRNSDGCDDVFLIEDADGHCILQLHFWDKPGNSEAAIAEAKAQMLVAALNLTGGGWVLPPYAHWILHDEKQMAPVWGIDDVQEVRPDLTDDQAWDVLQRVDLLHDRDRGITWETLRATAQELFPGRYELTGEPCI
jgi:hypothetical protein